MRREESVCFDAGRLRTGLEVIANQLGKHLDEDNPVLHDSSLTGAAWRRSFLQSCILARTHHSEVPQPPSHGR
jgi:hypothetical protein